MTAVKIIPTDEVLGNFKYRFKDDQALLWKGDFNFKDIGLQAEKAYYVLKKNDGKLKYEEVSKEVFENFNENNLPVNGKTLSSIYSIAVGISHQYDLVANDTKAQIDSMVSLVKNIF